MERFGIIGLLLFITIIILSSLGCLLLYSTAGGLYQPWAAKQAYAILLFLCIIIVIQFIPLRIIYKSSYICLGFGLASLIVADFIGHTAMGAQRWLKLGDVNFQPSELCKLAIIMSLARYFHDLSFSSIRKVKFIVLPIIIIIIHVILILRQPNLGTASIILILSSIMLFVTGVRIWKFVAVFILVLSSMPLIWHNMHDYQKQRVMTFINPQDDILGAGYNILQSKIAIGSGGLSGKGILFGTQTQLSFLPEKHTDFIFTVLAEELGFYGVIFTLLLYSMLLFFCYVIALSCNQHYSSLICIGVASMIFIHVFINIAMISGLIPAVGTPLPLLSYARSNLAVTMTGLGLVLNSYLNRRKKIKLHS